MMCNDDNMDLSRLFDNIREPEPDEVFVRQVSRRIKRYRFFLRLMQLVMFLAGVVIFALLTPWIMKFTVFLTMGSDLLAKNLAAVLISPAGWAVGGALGLTVLLRTRS
jgi:hypothetical protein